MFYFQQLLQQGLNGIDRTAMISTVVGIAYTILLIGFLIGLYQAGGYVQSLAVPGIQYLFIALLLTHWAPAFRQVTHSFTPAPLLFSTTPHPASLFPPFFLSLSRT